MALLLLRGHEKLDSTKSKLSGSIPSPPKPQQLIDGLASHRLKSLINQDNVKLPLMVPVPTHKFFANVGRPTFIKRELPVRQGLEPSAYELRRHQNHCADVLSIN